MKKSFGKILADARKEKGLSQEQLAFESNLHRTYISQLERDIKSPSLETIKKICQALNIKTGDLINRMEGEP